MLPLAGRSSTTTAFGSGSAHMLFISCGFLFTTCGSSVSTRILKPVSSSKASRLRTSRALALLVSVLAWSRTGGANSVSSSANTGPGVTLTMRPAAKRNRALLTLLQTSVEDKLEWEPFETEDSSRGDLWNDLIMLRVFLQSGNGCSDACNGPDWRVRAARVQRWKLFDASNETIDLVLCKGGENPRAGASNDAKTTAHSRRLIAQIVDEDWKITTWLIALTTGLNIVYVNPALRVPVVYFFKKMAQKKKGKCHAKFLPS